MSLLARILAALVSALVVAGAIVMGFFVGAVLVGLAVVGGLALAARVWWLRRRLRGVQPMAGASVHPGVIEGEYRVVEPRDEGDGQRDGRAGPDDERARLR